MECVCVCVCVWWRFGGDDNFGVGMEWERDEVMEVYIPSYSIYP